MSDIPQDVMDFITAKDTGLAPGDGFSSYDIEEVASYAILAERKRCADVARKYLISGHAYATASGNAVLREIEDGA